MMLARKLFVVLLILLILMLLLPLSGALKSQESKADLSVVIKPLEPFVMGSGSDLQGFSIDLWREIADRLQLKYQFVQVSTVGDQLAAVENGTADVAITGISITADREGRVDFSYPYFNAGLQIMTRTHADISLGQIISNLFTPGILQIVALFALVIITGGHLIWLIERRTNPNFPRRYFRGVIEGMWWSSVMVVTANMADEAPRSALSRLVSLIWLLIGVLLIANFTASVTATVTVNHLENVINDVNDLNGRQILTVAGSTADEYLQRIGIHAATVSTIQDAYPLLEAGKVDAIVYDTPVLRYYEARGGSGKVKVVGQIFNPEDYGIALPNDSPLRENINRTLLMLKEDGTYQRIYQFWFGNAS
ncbi:MAG: transporter substrate-binding domain-containing protein [Chloroflexota bacterium]